MVPGVVIIFSINNVKGPSRFGPLQIFFLFASPKDSSPESLSVTFSGLAKCDDWLHLLVTKGPCLAQHLSHTLPPASEAGAMLAIALTSVTPDMPSCTSI